MDADRPSCPQCGTDLARVVRLSGVRWPCPSCGGMAVELGVLEQIGAIGEGPGDAPAASPCPFCDQELRVTRVGGADVGVCLDCEAAWVDAEARRHLSHAPRADAIAGGERCGACGAPWVPNSDGSCRCCYGFDGEHDPAVRRAVPGRHMTTAG